MNFIIFIQYFITEHKRNSLNNWFDLCGVSLHVNTIWLPCTGLSVTDFYQLERSIIVNH